MTIAQAHITKPCCTNPGYLIDQLLLHPLHYLLRKSVWLRNVMCAGKNTDKNTISEGEKNYLAFVQSFTRSPEFDGLPHSGLVTAVEFHYSYSTDEDYKGRCCVQGDMARKLPSQAETGSQALCSLPSSKDRLLYAICFLKYLFI